MGNRERRVSFLPSVLKVYGAQELTLEAVELLQSLLPERPLNAWFMQIVKEGTEKKFDLSHNDDWPQHTRPILEALFHAHYFVRIACKYRKQTLVGLHVQWSSCAAMLV